MGLALWGGALLGVVATTAAAQKASEVWLDGVAARIGEGSVESVAVILHSDVELRARMAVLATDPVRAAAIELPAGLLAAALAELIGEQLIAREAERVQLADPSTADVSRELSRLLAGHAGQLEALTERLGVERRELELIARRRAIVAAFLRANLEGATTVSEQEVDERLRASSARLPGEGESEARARIANTLAKEAMRRNIERWVRVLRSRVPVRVLARYEGP